MIKYYIGAFAVGGVTGAAVLFGWLLLTPVTANETIDLDAVWFDETGELLEAAVELEATGEAFAVRYSCAEGAELLTSYDLGANRLTVTFAGEHYELPQAFSTTAARFALRDNSVIFTEEAGEAQLEIDNTVVAANCVAQDTDE